MEKQIFKVGDRVFDIRYGWGEVEKILPYNRDDSHLVVVSYNEYELQYYTIQGTQNSSKFKFLSFTEYTLQGFSQERPIELPEKGELVLVRMTGSNCWTSMVFEKYENGKYYTSNGAYWNECKRFKFID